MKKYPVLLFIAGLAILIILQSEIIMPLINKVVQSDLFLVESKDEGSQMAISNTMTDTAFMHCNTHIKSQVKNDALISFPQKPINVWSIGNYQYVVNAEYSTTKEDQTTINKYACRITYKYGDSTEGAADFNNWEVIGLSEPNQK
jgi:hypothetical protein